MPWQIGIDEAGYGPNLGPLLQTAVGTRLPNRAGDPWALLASAVRRHGAGDDTRLVIDDSKKVYGASNGFRRLELGVLAALCPPATPWPVPLGCFLNFVAPGAIAELLDEPWFDESDALPAVVEPSQLAAAAGAFHAARLAAALPELWVRARITPPALFNRLLDDCGNKAEVLSHGLQQLIREARQTDDGADAIEFTIDRQGGRIYHTALLEAACPDGRVEVVLESESQCVYRMRARRKMRWSFEVAAESRHFTVALASMTSKYLREVLMRQFNRFWQARVPELRATAGYPVDAYRFFDEIRTTMGTLRIGHRVVWRRR